MRYNWRMAGTMLHLLPNGSYTTLCNRRISGKSLEIMDEYVNGYPTCKRCLKLENMVR